MKFTERFKGLKSKYTKQDYLEFTFWASIIIFSPYIDKFIRG